MKNHIGFSYTKNHIGHTYVYRTIPAILSYRTIPAIITQLEALERLYRSTGLIFLQR